MCSTDLASQAPLQKILNGAFDELVSERRNGIQWLAVVLLAHAAPGRSLAVSTACSSTCEVTLWSSLEILLLAFYPKLQPSTLRIIKQVLVFTLEESTFQ